MPLNSLHRRQIQTQAEQSKKGCDQQTMATQANYPKLQPVHNILVCLDLTAIDPYLIRYAAFIARTLPASKVVFLHAIQAYDLPDRAQRDFPDVETALNEMIRDELYKSVDDNFREKCHWEVATQVGYEDAAKEVLDFIKENDIDLALIGQKSGENREARYGHKIAAEADSDILFVPQYAENSVDPLMCAIDFSDQSAKAFEIALDMHRAWGVGIMCYFIFDSTRAYFPATTDRSSAHIQQQSSKIYEKFLKGYGLSPEDIPCRIEIGDPMASEAENIHQAAMDKNARLIVVGARGETSTVTSLLGNIAETFRLMEKEIPVLIVKNPPKGRLSFLKPS